MREAELAVAGTGVESRIRESECCCWRLGQRVEKGRTFVEAVQTTGALLFFPL